MAAVTDLVVGGGEENEEHEDEDVVNVMAVAVAVHGSGTSSYRTLYLCGRVNCIAKTCFLSCDRRVIDDARCPLLFEVWHSVLDSEPLNTRCRASSKREIHSVSATSVAGSLTGDRQVLLWDATLLVIYP